MSCYLAVMQAAMGFSIDDMVNVLVKASRLSAYAGFTQCHITETPVEQPLQCVFLITFISENTVSCTKHKV
jgi:hypothetical protein